MTRLVFSAATRTALALLLLAATAFAQGRGPIQTRITGQQLHVPPISGRVIVSPIQEGPGAFSAAPAPTVSRIFGVVINELGLIVPAAGVVLVRSLHDGKVVGRIQVDNLGQFSLPGVNPGLYVAELVDGAGSVITSTPSFTVGIGQMVQLTPVVSQSSFGGLASLIGSSTAGTVNSAVSAGVLALETPTPLSPNR